MEFESPITYELLKKTGIRDEGWKRKTLKVFSITAYSRMLSKMSASQN